MNNICPIVILLDCLDMSKFVFRPSDSISIMRCSNEIYYVKKIEKF